MKILINIIRDLTIKKAKNYEIGNDGLIIKYFITYPHLIDPTEYPDSAVIVKFNNLGYFVRS